MADVLQQLLDERNFFSLFHFSLELRKYFFLVFHVPILISPCIFKSNLREMQFACIFIVKFNMHHHHHRHHLVLLSDRSLFYAYRFTTRFFYAPVESFRVQGCAMARTQILSRKFARFLTNSYDVTVSLSIQKLVRHMHESIASRRSCCDVAVQGHISYAW